MIHRPLSRRRLLAGAAATLALPPLASCTRGRGKRLEVAVVWSGGELDRFREVIDLYSRTYGEIVDVTSTGDDTDQFLSARIRAGNSPDIAVLSRPGLLRRYVANGWIHEVDHIDDIRTKFSEPWLQYLRVDGALFGVWVKAARKSMFWKRPSAPISTPTSWIDLVGQLRQLAESDREPAPVAIGAADGWVLTDWLENLLASHASAQTYEDLALGHECWDEAPVRAALDDLFDLWSIENLFPGGPQRALLTQWEESVMQVFGREDALTVFEGDFVLPVVNRFAAFDDEELPRLQFPFPSATRSELDRPLVVGGDAAVLMRKSDGAERLLAWLTEPDSFASWLGAGGFLLPNLLAHEADHYHDDLQRLLGDGLFDGNVNLRFDLSDLLAGPLGGADGVGSWRILQDFFVDATRRGADRDRVVARTAERMNEAARRSGDAPGGQSDACG